MEHGVAIGFRDGRWRTSDLALSALAPGRRVDGLFHQPWPRSRISGQSATRKHPGPGGRRGGGTGPTEVAKRPGTRDGAGPIAPIRLGCSMAGDFEFETGTLF